MQSVSGCACAKERGHRARTSSWALDTSGPSSASSLKPSPCLTACAAAVKSSRNLSYTASWTKMREVAAHICPLWWLSHPSYFRRRRGEKKGAGRTHKMP